MKWFLCCKGCLIIGKKLNLTQVAKQLGVSTATVSNAFNRPDQLSSKLRDRILSEAAGLGYHGPNLAARLLRKGESGVIGVMMVDSLSYSFSDPVASQLLQGIAEVLVENGKQMLLLSSALDSAEQSSAESLPDGFILYGALQGNSFEQIKRLGKPIVKVDYQSGSTHSVNIDNEAGAFIIAEHAIKGQEQSIAILGLRLVDSGRVCRLTPDDLLTESYDVAHSRLKGYLKAAHAVNMDITANQIWHVPINNAETAEVAVREVLGLSVRPKVILCMSDVIALTALRVAKELGVKVPEELRVTGFDDTPEASRSEPTLTTICQQSIEKGRVAAKLLLDSPQGDNTVQKIVLDTRLVIRQSCP